MTVSGCDRCTVRPAQNCRGTATYWGLKKTGRDDHVSFRVPTARTHDIGVRGRGDRGGMSRT
jgi:hypothetical protein